MKWDLMTFSCILAKSSFASEFSWFCPGEAIKNALFKCLCFSMSFFYFFFFWCKESHEVNDPKAELSSGDAKDELLAPPTIPTLLWHASSPWGYWATAGPEPGTFYRCWVIWWWRHFSALWELPPNTPAVKGIKEAALYHGVGSI